MSTTHDLRRGLWQSNWTAIEHRAGAFGDLWKHVRSTKWFEEHPHLQVSDAELDKKADLAAGGDQLPCLLSRKLPLVYASRVRSQAAGPNSVSCAFRTRPARTLGVSCMFVSREILFVLHVTARMSAEFASTS
jgi:hypothetical protein